MKDGNTAPLHVFKIVFPMDGPYKGGSILLSVESRESAEKIAYELSVKVYNNSPFRLEEMAYSTEIVHGTILDTALEGADEPIFLRVSDELLGNVVWEVPARVNRALPDIKDKKERDVVLQFLCDSAKRILLTLLGVLYTPDSAREKYILWVEDAIDQLVQKIDADMEMEIKRLG